MPLRIARMMKSTGMAMWTQNLRVIMPMGSLQPSTFSNLHLGLYYGDLRNGKLSLCLPAKRNMLLYLLQCMRSSGNKNVAEDIGLLASGVIRLSGDNQTPLQMAQNARHTEAFKHISTYYHFIREKGMAISACSMYLQRKMSRIL